VEGGARVIPAIIFDNAERVAIDELRRRGGNPHVDEDGRLRGAWTPSGYKRIEVAVVPVNAEQGFFRHGALGQDVDIVIFTDCAGRFWLATADEVRAS
jgi:hypothetical protein